MDDRFLSLKCVCFFQSFKKRRRSLTNSRSAPAGLMAPLEIYLTHLSRLISNLTKMPVGFPLVTDDKKFCSKGPFVCSAVVGTQLSGEYRKKLVSVVFHFLVF